MLQLHSIVVSRLRNLDTLTMKPNIGLNYIYGENASGKSSILEAIYLLSKLKSYRTKRIANVVSYGEDTLSVYAEGVSYNHSPFKIGIKRGYQHTCIWYNGKQILRASEQAKHIPMFILSPDYYWLFSGGAKNRRSWLDWSLFHVEPNYWVAWKRYYQALRHRNMLLKNKGSRDEWSGWEKIMAEEATKIDAVRQRYIDELTQLMNDNYLPMVIAGKTQLVYHAGWDHKIPLEQLLFDRRKEDEKRGYSLYGPHRVDISIQLDGLDAASHLSRGQAKLYSIALLSAQRSLVRQAGYDALLLVDDIDAELDQESSAKVNQLILEDKGQSFVTSLSHQSWFSMTAKNSLFHVKQGHVEKIV